MKLLVFLAIFTKLAHSANILAIFPQPSPSNAASYRALTDVLEERGHVLTIITAHPRKDLNGSRAIEIDFSFMGDLQVELFGSHEAADIAQMTAVVDAYYDAQFGHPHVKQLLELKDRLAYDVVLVEFANLLPWQAFALIFDAPVVAIATPDVLHTYDLEHGNLVNPVLHPDAVFPFLGGDLDFWQRARLLRYYLSYHLYYKRRLNRRFDKIIERHIGPVPLPTDTLNSIAEVLLVNSHPALGNVRPVLQTTVQLGFMHVKPPKAVGDEKLREFLESSSKPVVLVSLPSSVSGILREFFESIARDFDVVWSTEEDEGQAVARNVFAGKWLPVADLLAQERVQVFVMQGDQKSMEEAIDRGVPMIAVPTTAQQHANAQRIEQLGIGNSRDRLSLSAASLEAAVREVASGNFTSAVSRLSGIVKDEPMRPLERAVWWIEYVTRHGGTFHLDYKGRLVPFWKHLGLDFIAIGVVALHLALKALKFAWRSCFSRSGKKGKRRKILEGGGDAKKKKKAKNSRETRMEGDEDKKEL